MQSGTIGNSLSVSWLFFFFFLQTNKKMNVSSVTTTTTIWRAKIRKKKDLARNRERINKKISFQLYDIMCRLCVYVRDVRTFLELRGLFNNLLSLTYRNTVTSQCWKFNLTSDIVVNKSSSTTHCVNLMFFRALFARFEKLKKCWAKRNAITDEVRKVRSDYTRWAHTTCTTLFDFDDQSACNTFVNVDVYKLRKRESRKINIPHLHTIFYHVF